MPIAHKWTHTHIHTYILYYNNALTTTLFVYVYAFCMRTIKLSGYHIEAKEKHTLYTNTSTRTHTLLHTHTQRRLRTYIYIEQITILCKLHTVST